MKFRFKERTGKRRLSVLMAIAMVVTSLSLPQTTQKVYASETVSAPSNGTFLTNDQLKELKGNSDNAPYYATETIFQKVNFGNETWYIIGAENYDNTDTLVLLSDSQIASSKFDDSSSVYKESYIYQGLNSSEDSYKSLNYNVDKLFTADEKALIKPVTVSQASNSYLYLPDNNEKSSEVFKVGTKNQFSIPIAYWKSNNSSNEIGYFFWLRSAYDDSSAFSVWPGSGYVNTYDVDSAYGSVVPAFHLNLSSVLFASAATAATSTDEFDTDNIMTIRYNGSSKITSSATANASGISVEKPTEGEHLYVQWKDGSTDKVKSFELNDSKTTYGTDDGLPTLTSDCKIWIEKKDADNLVYAKMVEFASSKPLTFTAQDNSSITFRWDSGEEVYYSMDGGKWEAYKRGTRIEIESGRSVSFKGRNVKTNWTEHFSMTGTIAASGDVTSLTNLNGGDTTLEVSCYESMFNGCTGLTKAPDLPATTLAKYCYTQTSHIDFSYAP